MRTCAHARSRFARRGACAHALRKLAHELIRVPAQRSLAVSRLHEAREYAASSSQPCRAMGPTTAVAIDEPGQPGRKGGKRAHNVENDIKYACAQIDFPTSCSS